MRGRPVAADNFLVPNATFIVELIIFAIILWLLGKYVLPPINRRDAERQEAIRRRVRGGREGQGEGGGRREGVPRAARRGTPRGGHDPRGGSRGGRAIIAEMREQAQAESARILQHAHLQVEAERQQVLAQLRTEVGTMATTLAGRIVGESLEDDERRNRTVERFIATLESRTRRPRRGPADAGRFDTGAHDAARRRRGDPRRRRRRARSAATCSRWSPCSTHSRRCAGR